MASLAALGIIYPVTDDADSRRFGTLARWRLEFRGCSLRGLLPLLLFPRRRDCGHRHRCRDYVINSIFMNYERDWRWVFLLQLGSCSFVPAENFGNVGGKKSESRPLVFQIGNRWVPPIEGERKIVIYLYIYLFIYL